MVRIRFAKGGQRKFFEEVIRKMNSPSLRNLKQYGIETTYSSLKKYSIEIRTIPENLFNDLCELSGIDKKGLKFEIIENNWGQKKKRSLLKS